jgi:hypothetical protein
MVADEQPNCYDPNAAPKQLVQLESETKDETMIGGRRLAGDG